ncbi:uncharacterized protein [Hetaerina americana]|uniref:uncharacterized protein n=1 Tax=Hetaerina americana TaxID=62018 RepID=UPI003A7F1C40
MAEKRKMPGEKRSSSVGKALLSPTRSSPRNKANNTENASAAEVAKEASKSKRTLIDHFKPMPRTTKKQPVQEPVPAVPDPPAVTESDGGAPPAKKRGRKPGPKKANSEAVGKVGSGKDDGGGGPKGEVSSGGKKADSGVNGVYENIIWANCEGPKTARGPGKRAQPIKEAESSLEEAAEAATGPNLTYPGDLKCDSCQRTFSNSSGFKRHLKFCLDAEGPPVIMKIKKPGASPVVNGAVGVGKRVTLIDKYMSKVKGAREEGGDEEERGRVGGEGQWRRGGAVPEKGQEEGCQGGSGE